ncbi:hypothetical protein QVD17_23951 [Tagetes erecta]|uniref:Uncharacterized protein n=1 Tax=Tagetes erecta TaxID=13708 RepID=A0AAD8KHM0_TARER|nr:hypothetical protein QVD17_23951 [Tagetes erecta]
MKCFIMNHKLGENSLKNNATETAGINRLIWRSMDNVIKSLQLPIITGVLLGLLFSFDHCHGRVALAASGGRMGGTSFSSDSYSSSSSTNSSSSYSSSSSSSDDNYYYSTSYASHTKPTNHEVKPTVYFCVILGCLLGLAVFSVVIWYIEDMNVPRTSVLRLQVGSLGSGRSLQKDLNRIAESADTSTSKGFHYVLQESILALLRHSDHCISGYSSVDVKKSVDECEKRYNQLSIEERGKFDEETLVNVNNIKKKSATSQSSEKLLNEYIVVTIIVAARGVPQLPRIKNSAELKKALENLASIPSSNIMGAEVLWTPQKEDDCLTEQEMHEDYPRLHPF